MQYNAVLPCNAMQCLHAHMATYCIPMPIYIHTYTHILTSTHVCTYQGHTPAGLLACWLASLFTYSLTDLLTVLIYGTCRTYSTYHTYSTCRTYSTYSRCSQYLQYLWYLPYLQFLQSLQYLQYNTYRQYRHTYIQYVHTHMHVYIYIHIYICEHIIRQTTQTWTYM